MPRIRANACVTNISWTNAKDYSCGSWLTAIVLGTRSSSLSATTSALRTGRMRREIVIFSTFLCVKPPPNVLWLTKIKLSTLTRNLAKENFEINRKIPAKIFNVFICFPFFGTVPLCRGQPVST